MDVRAAKIAAAILKSELRRYRPYPKQARFHELGATYRERALLAANQSGKTKAASMEVAMHLTGRYPEWWLGRRWDRPTRWWASGPSAEATRDNPQRLLLGDPQGTGSLPESSILDVKRSRATADSVNIVKVQHISGGVSHLAFRTYEQDRKKWQGETLNGLWFDEEPPLDHYIEGLTRTNATNGITLLTATPLLGMTQVVLMFYPKPDNNDRALVQMTIDDALHYTKEQRERVIRSYPAWQREARVKGIPMLGTGRVFPIPEEEISCDPFVIPSHWGRIGGIDFGWDHPTAAVDCAYHKDHDVFYVTRCYKRAEAVPTLHAAVLRKWGNLNFAWPHDGYVHDRSSGQPVADLYRQEGLRMLRDHATFQDGGFGLEARVLELVDRMETGRFKVFRHLEPWWQEFRLYHRKPDQGGQVKIVKEYDDLLSATQVAMMMKRFARPEVSEGGKFPASVGLTYDPLGDRRRM